MIEADSVHSTPPLNSSSIPAINSQPQAHAGSVDSSIPQSPPGHQPDERPASEPPKPKGTDEVGMAWWNRITEQERAKWLERAGSARPIDAWEAYRRSGAQAEEISTTRRNLLKGVAPVAVSLASATAIAGASIASVAAKALPALADTDAQRIWAARQGHIERLRALIPSWLEAREKLPVWAKPGPRCIDRDGNPCDGEVNWTIDPTVATTVPYMQWDGKRVVRPSPWDIKREHESYVEIYGDMFGKAGRAKCLAAMDQRLAALEVREQERRRTEDELGITEFDFQITAAADGVSDCEAELDDLDRTPDVAAAMVMAELGPECLQEATIAGDNRTGTMRIAAAALEALLPNLSGLIREHATFFVANRTTALSAMPFRAP